jgi:hypothetical protein
MNSNVVALVLAALSLPFLDGCNGGSGACAYKGKGGFCFTPPAGVTPTESTDKVIFTTSPKAAVHPAQDVVVETRHVALDADTLKNEKSYAKMGSVSVLEESPLADGKGFFIVQQSKSNIFAFADVPGAGNTYFHCSYEIYIKDKAALKQQLQACKSLRAQ